MFKFRSLNGIVTQWFLALACIGVCFASAATNYDAVDSDANPLRTWIKTHKSGPGLYKWNFYIDIYHKYFNSFRQQAAVRFLEIGINGGGSLLMWRNYFGNNSVIHGFDINPKCKRFENTSNGIYVHIGDQSNRTFLNQLTRKLLSQGGPFDIIVDDGSHIPAHQKATFDVLFFRVLRPGGLYLVEDVHSSYLTQWGGGWKKQDNFMEYAKTFLDVLHFHWFREEALTSNAESHIHKHVAEIHFHDSMVLIQKNTREQSLEKWCLFHPSIGRVQEPRCLQVGLILAGDDFVP